jgi:N-acyl-L-homoserine lactone synthetase
LFEFREAKKEELEKIFKLRYQVYCVEKGYLKSEDYPDGLEKDKFDEHSVHFVALETTNTDRLIGCVRLILFNKYGFPAELHCTLFEKTSNPNKTIEISRLIVDKDYRSSRHFILLGLCKEIYLYNKLNNITHCYAVVDRLLFELLQKLGLPFKQIGESALYMGETIPTILSMDVLEEILPHRNAWFYEYLQAPKDEQNKWF